MGSGGTKEGNRFVKCLIKHEEIPWYLLLLPNGKWAAFWSQGMDSDYSEAIFNGDYNCPPCAFIGNKKDTIEYILESLHELHEHDSLNYNFQICLKNKNTRCILNLAIPSEFEVDIMLNGRFSGVMKGVVTQLAVRNIGKQTAPTYFLNGSAKHDGSSLVRELISNDADSINAYNKYLKAYQMAKELFEKDEYSSAKEKCDEAFSQLVEVDTVTAALGKDFFKMNSLLEEIEKKISPSGTSFEK